MAQIGEIASSNLDTIVNKLWELENKTKKYCRQHNRTFSSTISLGPKLIILKYYIN